MDLTRAEGTDAMKPVGPVADVAERKIVRRTTRMEKFGVFNESKEWVAYDYGNIFFRQPMSSGERLVIGPSSEQVELMLGLIYARYLSQYDRAKGYLMKAIARLHSDREISMARSELIRIEPLTIQPGPVL